MKKFLVIPAWLITTSIVLFLSLFSYQYISAIPSRASRPKIAGATSDSITSHAVLPETIGAFIISVKSNDAIPVIIKKYLEKYNSPLLPHADALIVISRKYDIDPRLLIAIAQQESNLCKKIPDDSHNCWGWGIHSQGTLKFDNYPQAIEAVSKGLSERYFGQGLDTPEEIMDVYTPLSQGSWAKGVQQFLDEME